MDLFGLSSLLVLPDVGPEGTVGVCKSSMRRPMRNRGSWKDSLSKVVALTNNFHLKGEVVDGLRLHHELWRCGAILDTLIVPPCDGPSRFLLPPSSALNHPATLFTTFRPPTSHDYSSRVSRVIIMIIMAKRGVIPVVSPCKSVKR